MNQKIHSQTLARLLALVAVSLALANGAWAASITWGVATTIAGDTDVATSGTLKYAYAEANTGTPTVNGVPFTAVNRQTTALGANVSMTGFTGSASAAYTYNASPFNALSSSYQNILIGAAYGGIATVTLKNLTVGRTYLVQFWVNDPRGTANTETLSSTGGNTVTLKYDASGSTKGVPGQYAIGTFTADATTQVFNITSPSQMNAIQVRDVTSVWTSTSGGTWSTAGNWTGGNGTVASGAGVVADFSSLNITADTTVHLDSAITISTLLFGDTDTSSAAGWALDNNGNSANILTLGGNTNYPAPATISVGALGTGKDATISAVLAGTAGLTKTGAGQLILSGVNTYTGGTSISAGTLLVNGSLAAGSAVTVSNGATLGGVGTINGAATVNTGAWLDAGTNGVGTLTFGGNLTLNATATNIFTVTTSGNSQVSVAGTLTPNSSVIYIKTGGNQLGAGTNTLFTYGTVSDSFNTNLLFETTQIGAAVNASIVDDLAGHIMLVVPTPASLPASTISYGVSSLNYNGLGQSPTITFVGSTGARTTNYVGTGSTSYASVNAPTNMGSYYVSNTVAADANFLGATNNQAFTIGPGVSSWTYGGATLNYNGTAQTPTISFSGSTGLKTTNYVGTGSTGYASVNAPTHVGNYALTNTVLADVNYPGATNGVTFTIEPTNLTVTAQFNTKAYDMTTSTTNKPLVTSGSIQAGDGATLTEVYQDAGVANNKTLIPSVVITNAAGVNVMANYNVTLVSNFTGAITYPLGGNGTPYYLDVNGTANGFGSTTNESYIGLTNNFWTTSTVGTNPPAAFTTATAGGQLTVGYLPSDFSGESFTNTIDTSVKINGIAIYATNATVTLTSTDPSTNGNNGNSYFNVNGINVFNAPGSALIWNVLYGGAGSNTNGNGGFNMGLHDVTFSGGGTNTFITHMGFNSASGGGLTNNGSVINLNYAYTEASSRRPYGSGFTLNSGALTFGTTNATDAFMHFANSSFVINGGTIDNLSGAPLTLTPSTNTIIGGSFTFAGSSSLNLGDSNVVLTASPTVTVSANTLTIGGEISDGGSGYSLTKAGNGTLTLNGANTYSGNTTINAGMLQVNGSLASGSAVTVGSGATIGGVGTINGAVAVNGGAILAAGDNGVGTLTLSSNLTLNAASTNVFMVTTSSGASNNMVVLGTLTPNSSVIFIQTAGTQLGAGTNSLFTYGTRNTAFNTTPVFETTQTGPAANAVIVDDLAGHINLVITNQASSVNLNPTNITAVVSGSTLTLSWPADHLGWILQQQTNSLNVGLSSNWADVLGSGSITSTNMVISPVVPAMFYRLRLP